MIKLLKLSIVILLLSLTTTQSQEVQLGLRLESNVFKVSALKSYHIKDITPSALQINLAMYPLDNLAIDARLGVEGSKEGYSGIEYGLFVRYYPIKYVYGVTGIMIHDNNNISHNTGGQNYNTFVLPGIGIGLNPGHFFVEAMYLYPGNKEVGYHISFDPPYKNITTQLNWVWKFGVGFSLHLFLL